MERQPEKQGLRTDRAVRQIAAPSDVIYRALTTRDAVQKWLPPAGASGIIHEFEPRPGGLFRMTLVFDSSGETGARKSSSNTDVINGEFLELVPNVAVRQRFIFVSDDPAFAGAMVMNWLLKSIDAETEVSISAENVPPGIDPRDHQRGMHSSLANLANFVE